MFVLLVYFICAIQIITSICPTHPKNKLTVNPFSWLRVTSNFPLAHFKPHFGRFAINAWNSHGENSIAFVWTTIPKFFFSLSANVWYTQPQVGLIKHALLSPPAGTHYALLLSSNSLIIIIMHQISISFDMVIYPTQA